MLQRLRLIDGVQEVTLQSSTKGTGGGATGGGGCVADSPVFSVTITFEPLPSAAQAAEAAHAKTVAVTSSSTPSTSEGGAR